MRTSLLVMVLVVLTFALTIFAFPQPLKAISLGDLVPLLIDNDEIGRLFTQGLEKKYGIDQNPQRQTRVQNIGSKILKANNITGKYDFAVLATHDFNACSIYGGHIRINEGLLYDTQNNNAEAAFAIAHEIAHNELGHNKEAVKNFKIAYILDLAKITEKMPKLLIAGANAALAKRSRKNESAADLKGLEYMSRAGYKTTGAIAMARRIEAERKIAQKNAGEQSLLAQRFNAIFDTHPEPAKRADMAEDFYFQKKYGQTFKQVSGVSNEAISKPITGDLSIIIAHPSLWASPLRITDSICGVGIFNPSPQTKEDVDVNFYLGILRQGHLVAATCDNDSHNILKSTDKRFTFIDSPSIDPAMLIQSLKAGKTYASKDGTEIQEMNFRIGQDYPAICSPLFTFKLVFNDKDFLAPAINVFRDGIKLKDCQATERSPDLKIHEAKYIIDDKTVSLGRHWYVFYIPERLITSPITINVTHNQRDPVDFAGITNWQKGLVHFHSYYSDGQASLKAIWESAQEYGVKFIFMTDHADCFGKNVNHKNPLHAHKSSNPYNNLVIGCDYLSASMVPGVEWTLSDGSNRHLLVLGLRDYLPYRSLTEEEFFGRINHFPSQVCILKEQFHLGDDLSQTEMVKDATFNFGKVNATLKLWIKGSPFKDPIIWINRQEVGRVVTTDNKWHLFTFQVSADKLNNGQNLLHLESFIPDRWHTFDDCEVKDVWLIKN